MTVGTSNKIFVMCVQSIIRGEIFSIFNFDVGADGDMGWGGCDQAQAQNTDTNFCSDKPRLECQRQKFEEKEKSVGWELTYQ